MSECTHDCSSCSSNCSGAQPQSLIASPHKGSSIKKVIGVVSGKGGVGKSMVTDLLAVAFSRKGYHCAIMDADITGPSIPKAFGLTQKAEGTQDTIYPVKTKTGIDVMSINLLLENETDPVIWRGPVIAGAVGRTFCGKMSIICLLICRLEPVTYRLPYSSHCRLMALSSLRHHRIWYP